MRPAELLELHDNALPAPLFVRLARQVRALGTERLRATYRTTFWFDLSTPPSNLVEHALLPLRQLVPRSTRKIAGVEWWLSRMRTTNVQVDFHQDRDEKRALAGGATRHPVFSSVLFLNRTTGGLLAVTREPPNDDNPAKAPDRLDFALAAPRPNRFVVFPGDLTHGVLDARNQVPTRRLPGRPPLRLALIANWWERPPLGVPPFERSRHYRALVTF